MPGQTGLTAQEAANLLNSSSAHVEVPPRAENYRLHWKISAHRLGWSDEFKETRKKNGERAIGDDQVRELEMECE